jgi:hypothetical protein
VWKFEVDENGLLNSMALCKAQLMKSTQQLFGPPSAYEVMNVGACAR